MTKTVCSVCYLDKNIVDKVELLTCPEIVGKNTLPLCRNFLDMNIKFLATRLCVNPHQNIEKRKRTKKRQLETLVTSRKRKCRKRSWILFWGIYHTHCLKVSVKYSLHVIVA